MASNKSEAPVGWILGCGGVMAAAVLGIGSCVGLVEVPTLSSLSDQPEGIVEPGTMPSTATPLPQRIEVPVPLPTDIPRSEVSVPHEFTPIENVCGIQGLTQISEGKKHLSGTMAKSRYNGEVYFIDPKNCELRGKPIEEILYGVQSSQQEQNGSLYEPSARELLQQTKPAIESSGTIWQSTPTPEPPSADCSCTSAAGTYRECNKPRPGDTYMCVPPGGSNWVPINP